MPVREGGSYAADPKTGAETRVDGTVQEDGHRIEPTEPAPEVPSAPAASEPPADDQGGTAQRRRGSADPKTQE